MRAVGQDQLVMTPSQVIRLFALLVALAVNSAFAGPLDKCGEYTKYGIPSTQGDLLCRKGYALAHNPDRKVPDWVIEHLTKAKANGPVPRSDDFRADPDLAPAKRAALSDYQGSGYDRGHMAPAGDMQWNEVAMSESFLLSNMAPQIGPGMNRGIWKDLEEKVRTWAIHRGEVYIITGPIYAHEPSIKTIGANHVAVPAYFYKIIYDPVKVQAIAFVIPNESIKNYELADYLISVKTVESLSGLNFLSKLSKDRQRRTENRRARKLWE